MRTLNDIKNTLRCRWYFAKRLTMFTSIYEKSRCYGGPEEGGWYYNNYMLLDSVFTPFGIGMYKAERKLKIKHGEYYTEVYSEKTKGYNQDIETHYYC